MFAIGWPGRFTSVRYRVASIILLLLPLALQRFLIAPGKLPTRPFNALVLGALFTTWLAFLCVRPRLLDAPK
jgi:hypothetical protein